MTSRWSPLNSTDPGTNFVIAILLIFAATALVIIGGFFLLPIVIILAIAKGIHWYVNRPTPTDQLYAQTQQRSISGSGKLAERDNLARGAFVL